MKEENFISIYAELISFLSKDIKNNSENEDKDKKKEKNDFKSIFINKLNTFVTSFNYHKVSKDWLELTDIEKFNFEEQWKKSLKLLMKFCGNLYLKKVLTSKVIKSILGTIIIKFTESFR